MTLIQKILKQVIFPKRLNLLFFSVFLFGVAVSINAVVFPTILSLHNISATDIGLAFSTDVLGGIFMSFFLHKIVKNLGIMRTISISAAIYALIIALIYFYQTYFLWLIFAFLMGSCFFAYTITRQAWMNILLESHRRSVALGIFSMVLASGMAAGPMIIKFSGADNYISFLISSAFTIFSFLTLIPMKSSSRAVVGERRIPLLEFFKNNPRCFLARFFLDLQSYLLLTLTVVFGTRIGFSYEQSGLLITACMISGFSDVWAGFALKKIDPYKLIRIGFAGCMSCFLIILFYHKSYTILLALYFIFGCFLAAIYVSVFKITNEDYDKHHLVAANSTFQLIGSSGSLCGSLIGGALIDIFGANGFPTLIVFSSIIYLFYEAKNSKKNEKQN